MHVETHLIVEPLEPLSTFRPEGPWKGNCSEVPKPNSEQRKAILHFTPDELVDEYIWISDGNADTMLVLCFGFEGLCMPGFGVL